MSKLKKEFRLKMTFNTGFQLQGQGNWERQQYSSVQCNHTKLGT